MRHAGFVLLWLLLPAAGTALSADGPPAISRFLHEIVVERGENVGDIQCSGCSIIVRGNASGDVIVIGGNIIIEGGVTGDAVAFGGGVHILPPAHLDGDALAMGGSVQIDAGARTAGDTDSIPYFHVPGQRSLHPSGVATFLVINLTILLLAALAFRRRRTENLAAAVEGHPGMVILSGTVFAIIMTLLFLLTGVSKRFELLWILLITTILLFTCMTGYLGICGALGRLITRRDRWLLSSLAGASLLTLLLLIPIAGFLFFTAAFVAALGSAIVSGFGKSPDWLPGRMNRRSSRSEARSSQ